MIIIFLVSMIATLVFMVRSFVKENEINIKNKEIQDLKIKIDVLEEMLSLKR